VTLNVSSLRVTHKEAGISILERLTPREGFADEVHRRFPEIELAEIRTCHRYELYFSGDGPREAIAELWRKAVRASRRKFYSHLRRADGEEAVLHLFRLAAGLESMMVGEDQILGQVRQALGRARERATAGRKLGAIFERALRVGASVRNATKISRGAVSIGSAAVNLADGLLAGLDGKSVVVIGAGELGTLTCKALASRRRPRITIVNRTFAKARKLAKIIGAQAAQVGKIPSLLARADAVFVTTAAPQFVLKKAHVEEALRARGGRTLLLIDLAQPRNVDAELSKLPGLILKNIDDLRGIALTNLRSRRAEINQAERLVREEMERFKESVRRMDVEPFIASIYGRAEWVRRRELAKAVHLLKGMNEEQLKIIEDFSRELVERTLEEPVSNLRKAAVGGEDSLISAARTLFHEAEIYERLPAKSA